ncbi:flavin monoamine oxidase family protein [Sphaerisporangium fuscum]|uniref:flavin monoamine oxidase family protein n=1 Tax=Sphaerisporangium fuscum TaxID=2835868 RepID=UPI001BDCA5A4|nr:FAD-dependent oxidoreductase [Sphaerisporangium fuscum]
MDADVVVVGAGFAGLAAAQKLREAGVSVCVVEARDRVGGRVFDEVIEGDLLIERGGQWLGGGQHRMHALARRYGVRQYPTYGEGSNVCELGDGPPSRYRGLVPKASPVVLADFRQSQARLERMISKVPLEAPWAAARAMLWDGETVASWARRACLTLGARRLWQLYCEAVFSVQASDLSLLHLLFYARSGGGLEALVTTENGVNETRSVGGLQQIAKAMATELGDDVMLSAPVREIRHSGSGVVVGGDSGRVVSAAHCVISLPPTLAGRLVFRPALPGFRDQLTQRVPMGTVIKCFAVYDEPFWRRDGLTGQATSAIGPVKVTFDNSPPTGSPGVLLAFLEGGQGRALGRADVARRRHQVLRCLVRFFGPRAAKPERYIEQSWAEEEYSRGCYSGHFPPGVWTAYGPALRAPIGRLHWAGTETATEYTGFIEGAVRSGERAAAEVLEARG